MNAFNFKKIGCLFLLSTLVLSSACGNLLQSMIAKHGPTTDERGSEEMRLIAERGREHLSKAEYAEAIAEAPKVWRGFIGSDSRKGGIATMYFRDFCDALYAAEKNLPAFEIAALFQLAVAGVPKDISKNKADFVGDDVAKLGKRATEAAARAKPELQGLADAAAKREHFASELLYRAQLLRMYGDDPAHKEAMANALVHLKSKYTATVAFKGDAALAKAITGAAGRPSKMATGAAMLSAEGSITAPTYKHARESITLVASVVRGKKSVPNSRYQTFQDRVQECERNIKNHQDTIGRELKLAKPRSSVIDSQRQAIATNERHRNDALKSLAKEPQTVQVDNVVQVNYPAVRDVLSGELAVRGKVSTDKDKAADDVQKTLTASTDVVSHDGLAEARIAPQKSSLPPDESLHPQLISSAASTLQLALAQAFDKRLLGEFKAWLEGEKQDKAEAETTLLLLTSLPEAGDRAKRITALTRLPDVSGLVQQASAVKTASR